MSKIKKTFIGTVVCLGMFSFVSCNKQMFDTSYTFTKAYINLGNKTIEVDVESWTDFDDGDQIQIKTTDGKVYLGHSSNIILVKE
jgi:hypothetical protein